MLLTVIYLTYHRKDQLLTTVSGVIVITSVIISLLLGFHITQNYGSTYNIKDAILNHGSQNRYDTRGIAGGNQIKEGEDVGGEGVSIDYDSEDESFDDKEEDPGVAQVVAQPQVKGKDVKSRKAKRTKNKKKKFKVYPVNNNTVDTSYLHGKYVFGTNHIILYNRVPKCGSRTLLSLVEEMAKKNNFVQRLGEINPRAHYKGKSTDEIPFESMTRRRIKNTKVGTFLHGHVFFLDLSTEQSLPPHKKPIYINLLRDPVSRFVSAYYFGRYGDGRFTNLKQLHKLTRPEYIDETINECFERKRWECVGDYTKTMILRYFCGYSEACKQPTREALEIAKRNVDKYVVIGLVEEYETFLKILEKLIPDFFRGILTEFMSSKESIREAKMHAKHKVPPTPEVAAKMRDMFQLDYEFYNYTRTKFYELREKLGII